MKAYLCDVFINRAAAAAFANLSRRVLRPGLHGQPRGTVCVLCCVEVKRLNKTRRIRWFFAIQASRPPHPCASYDHNPHSTTKHPPKHLHRYKTRVLSTHWTSLRAVARFWPCGSCPFSIDTLHGRRLAI